MKAAAVLALIGTTAAFAPAPASKELTQLGETKADLQAMAAKLNPVIKVGLHQDSGWFSSTDINLQPSCFQVLRSSRSYSSCLLGSIRGIYYRLVASLRNQTRPCRNGCFRRPRRPIEL
jgi:hypothetical protein